jgi:hypothetical protein
MLEQPTGLGVDLPLVRMGQLPPLIHKLAQLVDDRSRIVLLSSRRKPFSLVKNELLLLSRTLSSSVALEWE